MRVKSFFTRLKCKRFRFIKERKMSARISLHGGGAPDLQRKISERFGAQRMLFPLAPRYNIAPHSRIAVITQDRATRQPQTQKMEVGTRYLEGYGWGFVPFWATPEDAEHRLAFARSETLPDKPAFRRSFLQRRCLIPANGFFLFKKHEGRMVPLYVRPRENQYFAFAGIWDEWVSPAGLPIRTVALITTEANRRLAPLHQRMPAILRMQDESDWLDPAHQNADELQRLLQPAPAKSLSIYAVSPRVQFENFNHSEAVQPLKNSEEILRELGIAAPKKRGRYAPRKRALRREYSTPDGQVFFKTRSFSRDEYISWHPVVDTSDGHVFCDCPDFRFRHAAHEPRLATPQHWCKHINRAVRNCRRHGEI
jgi:putative SOS response-associated peptidase YedK